MGKRSFGAHPAQTATTQQQAPERLRNLHIVLQATNRIGQLRQVMVRQFSRRWHRTTFGKDHGTDAVLVGQQQHFALTGNPSTHLMDNDPFSQANSQADLRGQ